MHLKEDRLQSVLEPGQRKNTQDDHCRVIAPSPLEVVSRSGSFLIKLTLRKWSSRLSFGKVPVSRGTPPEFHAISFDHSHLSIGSLQCILWVIRLVWPLTVILVIKFSTVF